MPVYEYQCNKCGHQFEFIHSIKDIEKKEKCPKCNSEASRKQFSVFEKGSSTDSCSTSKFT